MFQLNKAGAPLVNYTFEQIKMIEAGKDDDFFVYDAKKKQWDSARAEAARKEKEGKMSPFEKKGAGGKAEDNETRGPADKDRK